MTLYDVFSAEFELLGQVTAGSGEHALALAKAKWPLRAGLVVGPAEPPERSKRLARVVAGGLIGPYNRRVTRPH